MELLKDKPNKKVSLGINSIIVDIKGLVNGFKNGIIKLFKKFFNFITNKNNTSLVAIKKLILFFFGFGLIINYMLHFLFGIKFTIYTFPAWGMLFYFIKDELLEWIRRLIAKR